MSISDFSNSCMWHRPTFLHSLIHSSTSQWKPLYRPYSRKAGMLTKACLWNWANFLLSRAFSYVKTIFFFFTPPPRQIQYYFKSHNPTALNKHTSRTFASNWTSTNMKIKNAIHFSWSHVLPWTVKLFTLSHKIGVPISDNINHREIWK